MGGRILNFSIFTFRGQEGQEALLPRDDAAVEHVWVAPQGPLESPAPRGPRVEPCGARAGQNRARRVARAVPGSEAHRTKMGDVHAEQAPEAPMDPTDPTFLTFPGSSHAASGPFSTTATQRTMPTSSSRPPCARSAGQRTGRRLGSMAAVHGMPAIGPPSFAFSPRSAERSGYT